MGREDEVAVDQAGDGYKDRGVDDGVHGGTLVSAGVQPSVEFQRPSRPQHRQVHPVYRDTATRAINAYITEGQPISQTLEYEASAGVDVHMHGSPELDKWHNVGCALLTELEEFPVTKKTKYSWFVPMETIQKLLPVRQTCALQTLATAHSLRASFLKLYHSEL